MDRLYIYTHIFFVQMFVLWNLFLWASEWEDLVYGNWVLFGPPGTVWKTLALVVRGLGVRLSLAWAGDPVTVSYYHYHHGRGVGPMGPGRGSSSRRGGGLMPPSPPPLEEASQRWWVTPPRLLVSLCPADLCPPSQPPHPRLPPLQPPWRYHHIIRTPPSSSQTLSTTWSAQPLASRCACSGCPTSYSRQWF